MERSRTLGPRAAHTRRWRCILLLSLALPACAPDIVPDAADQQAFDAAPPTQVMESGDRLVTLIMNSVPAGAEFEVELLEPLHIPGVRPGDEVNLSVSRPLIVNYTVYIPLNSLVTAQILALRPPAREGDEPVVSLGLRDVMFNGRTWPLVASVVGLLPPIGGELTGKLIQGSLGESVASAAMTSRGSQFALSPVEEGHGLGPGTIFRVRLDETFVFGVPDI